MFLIIQPFSLIVLCSVLIEMDPASTSHIALPTALVPVPCTEIENSRPMFQAFFPLALIRIPIKVIIGPSAVSHIVFPLARVPVTIETLINSKAFFFAHKPIPVVFITVSKLIAALPVLERLMPRPTIGIPVLIIVNPFTLLGTILILPRVFQFLIPVIEFPSTYPITPNNLPFLASPNH
jgi:hypothetical protein